MTKLILGILFLSFSAEARIEKYTGVANHDGKVAYIEKHQVTYDDASGKVLSAVTEYRSEKDALIATLKTDFSKSLTSPDHVFTDLRDGSVHGVRNVGNKKILFKQDKGKEEKTSELDADPKMDEVTFGCQGLNYYVLANTAKIEIGKSVPIVFLIPGKLDSYNFELEYMKKNPDGILEIEIEIHSFFLKLFAPKLYVKYDLNKKHIVWYKGISNVPDDKGDTQKVEIDYTYES